MRNEGIVKFLFICTLGLVVLVFLNAFFIRSVRHQYAPGTQAAASVLNISGQLREWSEYLSHWKDISHENEDLHAAADKYAAAEAHIQALESENDTLRKAAGLSARIKRSMIPAGIFNVSLSPNGYRALINKGQTDGVAVGQAVISSEGMLIGKVSAVFSSSSQVMLTSDPEFSATVKVLNGSVSGILRGAMTEGLTLDLVTQSDDIIEGNTLVTTGDDLIPSGLTAGVVRHVENNDTQLFKKVKVNPAADPSSVLGTVLVVKQ